MKTKEEIKQAWVEKFCSTASKYNDLANGHSKISAYVTLLYEEAEKRGFEAFREKVEEGVKKQVEKYDYLANGRMLFGQQKDACIEVLTTIRDIKQ